MTMKFGSANVLPSASHHVPVDQGASREDGAGVTSSTPIAEGGGRSGSANMSMPVRRGPMQYYGRGE
jgi:hypothetical protein